MTADTWFPDWKRPWIPQLQADLLAGLSVAAMAVPQCVCFAGMAGLPASYGLYGVIVPSLGYALCGSSPYLAVGPVALVSLLLHDRLEPLVPGSAANINPSHPADEEAQLRFNTAAIQVALVMGAMLVLLRIAGASIWTHLLSKPIVDSFLTAGALVIAASQLKYLVGVEIPRGSQLQAVVAHMWQKRPDMRWQELLMGCCWLAILLGQRVLTTIHRGWIWTRPFGSLLVAGLSIAVVWLGHLHEPSGTIRVVGPIQPGLPPWTAPAWFPLQIPVLDLLLTAASMTAVSLLEALSVARALADSLSSRPKPACELLGLGLANMAGAAFGAYPATGSFARSAVAHYAGARSRLTGVITALSMVVVLLVATRPFELMPLNALAAIVIAGVIPLVDFGSLLPLLKGHAG
ncbi:hypothetical protein WJX84_002332 [Apatococcus fuscideae]|uniref:SLC26A/SulP transporter domain-containing protein n=1 Tax=Apatococcus fuscideae TaxID=2026836 RepID=A0AAW1TFE1_9CHLO